MVSSKLESILDVSELILNLTNLRECDRKVLSVVADNPKLNLWDQYGYPARAPVRQIEIESGIDPNENFCEVYYALKALKVSGVIDASGVRKEAILRLVIAGRFGVEGSQF